MSIAAKFSLRDLLLANWSTLKLKTNLSVFVDMSADSRTAADCQFIGIYQLPDIASGKSGHAFDPLVIRYFYSPTTAFTEMDAEVAFGNLTDIFKHGVENHTYAHAGVTYHDDFEYVDGSENKSGRQTTGSKLPYKQFTVLSPKTNIV